jgi:hypothetical protein
VQGRVTLVTLSRRKISWAFPGRADGLVPAMAACGRIEQAKPYFRDVGQR